MVLKIENLNQINLFNQKMSVQTLTTNETNTIESTSTLSFPNSSETEITYNTNPSIITSETDSISTLVFPSEVNSNSTLVFPSEDSSNSTLVFPSEDSSNSELYLPSEDSSNSTLVFPSEEDENPRIYYLSDSKLLFNYFDRIYFERINSGKELNLPRARDFHVNNYRGDPNELTLLDIYGHHFPEDIDGNLVNKYGRPVDHTAKLSEMYGSCLNKWASDNGCCFEDIEDSLRKDSDLYNYYIKSKQNNNLWWTSYENHFTGNDILVIDRKEGTSKINEVFFIKNYDIELGFNKYGLLINNIFTDKNCRDTLKETKKKYIKIRGQQIEEQEQIEKQEYESLLKKMIGERTTDYDRWSTISSITISSGLVTNVS